MAWNEKVKSTEARPLPAPTSTPSLQKVDPEPEFLPMYHRDTQVSVEFTDYFKGPRNIYSHSKWPIFMRLHGSVLPKLIVPMSLPKIRLDDCVYICSSRLTVWLERFWRHGRRPSPASQS